MNKRRKQYYSLNSFMSFFKRYKWRFLVVAASFVVADLLLAVIPLFIGKLIGALGSQPIDKHAAINYVWILIACSTGHDILWRLSEVLHMKLLIPLPYTYESIVFKELLSEPNKWITSFCFETSLTTPAKFTSHEIGTLTKSIKHSNPAAATYIEQEDPSECLRVSLLLAGLALCFSIFLLHLASRD